MKYAILKYTHMERTYDEDYNTIINVREIKTLVEYSEIKEISINTFFNKHSTNKYLTDVRIIKSSDEEDSKEKIIEEIFIDLNDDDIIFEAETDEEALLFYEVS